MLMRNDSNVWRGWIFFKNFSNNFFNFFNEVVVILGSVEYEDKFLFPI